MILQLAREGTLSLAGALDEATDLLWTLTSLQVWEQLVIDQGWTAEQYEQHLTATLWQTFIAASSSSQE